MSLKCLSLLCSPYSEQNEHRLNNFNMTNRATWVNVMEQVSQEIYFLAVWMFETKSSSALPVIF